MFLHVTYVFQSESTIKLFLTISRPSPIYTQIFIPSLHQNFKRQHVTLVKINGPRAYQVVKKVRFSENLACFVFLLPPFWDSPFCHITDEVSNFAVTIPSKTQIFLVIFVDINVMITLNYIEFKQRFFVFQKSLRNYQVIKLYCILNKI